MSRIAFVSEDETVMPACARVKTEGHRVSLWMEDADPQTQTVGRGLIDRPATLDEVIRSKPDVVVAYCVPEAQTACAEAGLTVWGSTEAAEAMERDRMEGIRLARRYGVGKIPETQEFTQLTEAIRYVEASDLERWVCKCSGEVETSTTHLADTKEHLLTILQSGLTDATSIVLQERIEGTEVSTEAWYDYRQGWIPGSCTSTFERKRLMPGDVGPMTGAMGSIVFRWGEPAPRLFRDLLDPMTPYLRQIEYVGPLDVNAIVTPEGPYFLEFTPRLGWDAFCAWMAGYAGAVGDFLIAMGKGEGPPVGFATDFMGALRIAVPEQDGMPLLAPWKAMPRNVMLGAVRFDGNHLRSTGLDSDAHLTTVFELGATGDTIAEVRRVLYQRLVPRILVPDITYRDDIGVQAEQDLHALADLAYDVPGVGSGPPMPMMMPFTRGSVPLRQMRG